MVDAVYYCRKNVKGIIYPCEPTPHKRHSTLFLCPPTHYFVIMPLSVFPMGHTHLLLKFVSILLRPPGPFYYPPNTALHCGLVFHIVDYSISRFITAKTSSSNEFMSETN